MLQDNVLPTFATRVGGAHFHAPGRPSPVDVLSGVKRVRPSTTGTHHHHRAGSAPVSRAATHPAAGLPPTLHEASHSRRAPAPPTAASHEALKHAKRLQDRLEARRVKEQYLTSVVQAAEQQHAPAIEVTVDEFVTQPAPALRDVGRDVRCDTPQAAAPCSAKFEASLLRHIQDLRTLREGAGARPSISRILKCYDMLDCLIRELRGPVCDFLSLFRQESWSAIFVSDAGEAYFEQHSLLRQQSHALRKAHTGIEQRLSRVEEERNTLKKDFVGDDTLLKKAERRIADLEDAEKAGAAAAQRGKDHTDFLNNQIDELQEALNKATKRFHNMTMRRGSGLSKSLSDLVCESDKEIASVMSFGDPGFDDTTRKPPPRRQFKRPTTAKPKAAEAEAPAKVTPSVGFNDVAPSVPNAIPQKEQASSVSKPPDGSQHTKRPPPSRPGLESVEVAAPPEEQDVYEMEKTHRFSIADSDTGRDHRVSISGLSRRDTRDTADGLLKGPMSWRGTLDLNRLTPGAAPSPSPRHTRMSVNSSISTFHASEVSCEWDIGTEPSDGGVASDDDTFSLGAA